MILYASYGYDMTINHYYKIVKNGEKTVLVQEIGKIIDKDNGMGGGNSVPDETKMIGKPFRAWVRNYGSKMLYVSKRIAGGGADEWGGKPDYYNTWD